MSLSATDIAAIYAAIVATAALALEVRRWVESRPRLRLSVMLPAVIAGYADDREFVFVKVSNTGSLPTTITHYTLHRYPNWVARWRRRATFSAIVADPEHAFGRLPHVLQPGTEWGGSARLDQELRAMIEAGNMYVGIFHSFGRRAVLHHLSLSKQPGATDEPTGDDR